MRRFFIAMVYKMRGSLTRVLRKPFVLVSAFVLLGYCTCLHGTASLYSHFQ